MPKPPPMVKHLRKIGTGGYADVYAEFKARKPKRAQVRVHSSPTSDTCALTICPSANMTMGEVRELRDALTEVLELAGENDSPVDQEPALS